MQENGIGIIDLAKDLNYIVTLDFGGYRNYQFDFFNCYHDAIDFINTAVRRYSKDDCELTATIEVRKIEKEESK